MGKTQKQVIEAVLDRHGRTYCAEIGIDIERNTPAPLFQLLVASLLFSARISAEQAVEATRALIAAGYTTPDKMAAASWQDRVDVLTAHGYKRYDESGSRMLGDTAEMLMADYRGDLRALREAAGHDPEEERRRLKAFKGIGDVGADIFFREVQAVWDEIQPFADRRALAAAERLGLPADPERLLDLAGRSDFVRLVAALVRTELAGDHDAITGG